MQAARFCLTVIIIGIFAHVLGERLHREKFNPQKFPYRAFSWEDGGKLYLRLGIQHWKEWMPDKSKFVKKSYTKSVGALRSSQHMLRLVQETCVAEFVHWVLLAISPVMLLTMQAPGSIVGMLLYGLSNIPFIMIQRYNRPRLNELYERLVRQQR